MRSVKYLRCLCFNFLSTLQIGGATLNCKIIYLPPDKFWLITMLNLSLNTPLHWISYKQPKIFSIHSWWDGYFGKSTEKARINAKISYILATPWLIWQNLIKFTNYKKRLGLQKPIKILQIAFPWFELSIEISWQEFFVGLRHSTVVKIHILICKLLTG